MSINTIVVAIFIIAFCLCHIDSISSSRLPWEQSIKNDAQKSRKLLVDCLYMITATVYVLVMHVEDHAKLNNENHASICTYVVLLQFSRKSDDCMFVCVFSFLFLFFM